MPLIKKSSYKSPIFLSNGHIQSIYPHLRRKKVNFIYERIKITTPDNDFLNVDFQKSNNQKAVLILHGLEGSSYANYIKGIAKIFYNNSYDIFALNLRGCGGELNQKQYWYHSGATTDLNTTIKFIIENNSYESISIISFSLGANITLKYLGEENNKIDTRIKSAVTFSVPCDLEGSAKELAKTKNKIFMYYFLKDLKKKIIKRKQNNLLPANIRIDNLDSIKTFEEFDNQFTAPIHGFKSAKDYWDKCNSLQFLDQIRIPTLIVNAANDPFLSPSCYPYNNAKKSKNLYLETPQSGGHVGFITKNIDNIYWSEKRALEFINNSS